MLLRGGKALVILVNLSEEVGGEGLGMGRIVIKGVDRNQVCF